MIVRAASRGVSLCLRIVRWLYYSATLFIWHRPAPPSTVIYGRIRSQHLPIRLTLGKRCRLGDNLFVGTSHTGNIHVGDDVNINIDCTIVAMERIEIGSNTSIAEQVSIRDQDHVLEPELGVRGGKYRIAPVSIGKNVWIGRGVYIGRGTVIGDNSIIGANSVVHGEFPPNSLIAGAPAKVKRELSFPQNPAAED